MGKSNSKRLIFFPCLAPILFFSFLTINPPALISAYQPSYIVTLNCGSSADSFALDNRKWAGESTPTNWSVSTQQSNASVTATALRVDPSVGQVPYSTARIFHSQYTYSFTSVPTGPKFVRLHFYPAPYPEFNATNTFFSVKIGKYTVLSNFSASLNAQKSKKVVKEFCINVDVDKSLSITFVPSSETSESGYAFVNGIEIVSMPDSLYYTQSGDMGIPIVGQSTPFRIDTSSAMETMYRLNVGGQEITPVSDSGLFRSWLADEDLMDAFIGITYTNTTIRINYSDKFPSYIAPEEVYQTERSMGWSKELNVISNLTWRLPVNSGFTYLVRLHFCEINPLIISRQDREFHIYIDGTTVEPQADVIVWSGKNGAPIYRDYMVIVPKTQLEILVQMHPNSDTRTSYNDVKLNGLELLKLNNGTLSLAGPNPTPPILTDTTTTLSPNHQHQKSSVKVMIAVGIGSCIGFMIISLLIFMVFRRRRRTCKSEDHNKKNNYDISNKGLPSNVCRHFSLAEIRTATKDFDQAFVIGRGGFGDVYKGYVDGGATSVAIKRLKPGSKQGAPEFMTEIGMLSQLRHLHLVSLIGYCRDEGEMILVYDFMSRGTLCDHLYNTDNPPLTWKQRLQICIGAAKGLHYLHAGAKHMIIHRDVKSTNILLDDKWVAKISDFGLSKINPKNLSNAHVSTAVKGSLGYLDPEYWRRQQLTEKSDVYSFGVVLLEVLCGRPPIKQKLKRDEVNLAAWARKCYENGTFNQIVDPNLKVLISSMCLEKFREIVMSCLHDEGIQRPSMSEVVWGLEFALQLQESAEEGINEENALLFHEGDEERVEIRGGHVSNSVVSMTSKTGTSFTSISSDDRMSSGAVFSEIFNPKAR